MTNFSTPWTNGPSKRIYTVSSDPLIHNFGNLAEGKAAEAQPRIGVERNSMRGKRSDAYTHHAKGEEVRDGMP